MENLEDIIEIAYPQQPHCPVVLILDSSASMAGEKMAELIAGIHAFLSDLMTDELARKRVDLAVISFGKGVSVVQDFSPVESVSLPDLTAEGFTPMGAAISRGIDLVEERKQQYRDTGVDYYRPWIILITDGRPTDMQPGEARWDEVVNRIHGGEAAKQFLFFAIGVDKADMERLVLVSPPNRTPLRLKETRFTDLFLWLSRSLSRVSQSTIGEQIDLGNPTGPDGWGTVPI